MNRRDWLKACGASVGTGLLLAQRSAASMPTDDVLATYRLAWTAKLPWGKVCNIQSVPGSTVEERLVRAQTELGETGGVIYFPAGDYYFTKSILLHSRIILRGATPTGATKAHDETYDPPTRFHFPKYEPRLSGTGTPLEGAFCGIYCVPTAEAVGVCLLQINRGHIHFPDSGAAMGYRAGARRFVVGCVLRNAAVADLTLPKLDLGQAAWQRFTNRHHAAIDVKADQDLLVANNRLPQSGDDNFTMNEYVLLDPKKKPVRVDGIVFDYDNRPGLYVNHYSLGGAGGQGPDGTPETHPHGFRRGIIIRDNYLYQTGRMGIGFSGLGTICTNNIIRMPANIWRPTNTGINLTTGSSTNDNRAVEMRGWAWVVEDNDYIVHRNWAYDKKYYINDGEGLMHEDHVNSTVKDSVLRNNRGNTYLSIYKTAGIDGLVVEDNEIFLNDGKQTIARGAAIFVSADRSKDRFPIRRVSILNNRVRGGGILVAGDPAEQILVRGNQHLGAMPAPLMLPAAGVTSEANEGFTLAAKS